MFLIYKAQYNPSNLTGQVGGDISTYQLSGYIGELFYHITAPASGVDDVTYQYRKVFFKNSYNRTSTNTRVWVDAAEHLDQLSICASYSMTDTTTTPTGQPSGVTGWVTPLNYSQGIDLGTLATNAYTGIWIRQALSGITSPDPYATFRLYVGGLV